MRDSYVGGKSPDRMMCMNAHYKGGFDGQYHAGGYVAQGSCVRGRERLDDTVRPGAYADVF